MRWALQDTLYCTLRDSTIIQGEILVVRDSSLVASPKYHANENWLRSNIAALKAVPESRILKVALAGRTHAAAGAGVGAFVGALAGGKIGSNGLEGGEKSLGMLGGGFLGCIVGGFVGIGVGGNISSGAEEMSPQDSGWWERLRSAARYEEEEPEFLRPVTLRP